MSGLPSGYKQLEYIESSGTQRIDTGVVPVASTQRIVLSLKIVTLGNANRFIGSFNGSLRSFTAQTSGRNFGVGQGSLDIFPSGLPQIAANTKYEMDLSAGDGQYDYTINNSRVTGTYSGSRANGTAMSLFAMYYSAGTMTSEWYYEGKMQIYSCQIYTGTTLVRNFVPCKNASGAVGLYDTVEGQFYANAGTGTFAAGPEILPPAAPAGLQTVLAVVLQWAASANADRYDVYRDGAKLGSTEDTQYVDATPEANQTYVYTVKAVNGGGESAGASITVYTKSGYFEYKPLIESANFP